MNKLNATQALTNARLLALQALYMHTITQDNLTDILTTLTHQPIAQSVLMEKDGREVYVPIAQADTNLLLKIVRSYEENRSLIDTMLEKSLAEGTTPEQLDSVLQLILKTALAERLAQPNLDLAILISEYSDLTRAFYNGDEVALVNAILNRVNTVIGG